MCILLEGIEIYFDDTSLHVILQNNQTVSVRLT